MLQPLISIVLVVYNGERYIRHCLRAALTQTYSNFEVIVFDNASTDATHEIVRREFPQVRMVENPINLGMWPGQEAALEHAQGEYILALSVDVMLDPKFLEHAAAAIQKDPQIGAVQGKLYQYELGQLASDTYRAGRVIDTCGFKIFRSRKIGNLGHGEPDHGQYDNFEEIFGVEGAAPMFRRGALENIRIEGHIADPDYFWYGDDLDIAWRLRLLGWRQVLAPKATAWHDRSTTKGSARAPIVGQLGRLAARRAIPLRKRRLDWSNVRFTILKNDYIINVLRDLPWILAREIATFGYWLLFEPGMFAEWGRFLRLLPRMLRRRRKLMARGKVTPGEMRRWFG